MIKKLWLIRSFKQICLLGLVIILGFLISETIVFAGNFVIAPYLRNVTSESAVISWELPEAESGYLYYGTSREEYQYKKELKANKYHLVQLNNLKADTMYYYMVKTDNYSTPKGDYNHFFRTVGTGRVPFTFAVLGDTSSGKDGFDFDHKRVINSIMDYTFPEFVILSGDLVMDGQRESDWLSFFKVEEELLSHTPIYASRGNNEEYGKEYFDKYFQRPGEPSWHSFDYAGNHFIALNILKGQGQKYYDSFRPGSEQFTWLLEDLQSEDNKNAAFTFVFFHAPVFPPQGDTSQVLEELLHPLFVRYGVDMVFNGTHTFSRAEKEGVAYYISGGGGAELFRNPLIERPEIKETEYFLHHLRVRVNYPVITVEAVDTNGNTFSSYRYWDPEADDKDKGTTSFSTVDKEKVEAILEGKSKQGTIPVTVFSMPNCGYCDRLLDRDLPELERKTGINLEVNYLSLDQADNFETIVYIEELLNDRDNELPAVLIGRNLLGGEKEIKANLEDVLLSVASSDPEMEKNILENKNTNSLEVSKSIKERFVSIKMLPVISAGLLDGINPCAFTAIIFLLSYLVYIGKNKKEILLGGIGFTLGVFITYMLIGFGLSELLSSLSFYSYISNTIEYLTFVFVIVLGIYNLYDFYLCRKGKEKEMKLQLSKFLKLKIYKHIRSKVRSPHLVVASLVLGFFVSAFELACTGQVYIPTIIYMLDISAERVRAFAYLTLYNLAFIFPLVIIFIAVYFGLSEDSVKKYMQKNLALVKLGTALLFFGLGAAILFFG